MVQRMTRAALSGKGATQIARSLNDDGLRTVSGNRWTKNTVLHQKIVSFDVLDVLPHQESREDAHSAALD